MFLPSRRRARRAHRAIVLATGLVASTIGSAAPPASAAPAGVTVIGMSSNGSSSSRTTITLKRPAGTVAGQVMVAAIVGNDDQPGFTAPSGWTVVRDDSVPDKLRQAVYVKVAGVSEPPSFTWTIAEWRRLAGGITTYAGVDPSHPLDSHSAFPNGAKGTSLSAPGLTTSVDGTVLVHIAAINAEGTIKPPPGMKARWTAASPNKKNSADVLLSFSDALMPSSDPRPAPAGDSGPRTATASKAGAGISALLALRPIAAPATAPVPDPPLPPDDDGDPVLVGAGDIASCADNRGAAATAALLDHIPGTVFTLGDNAYTNGTPTEFGDCYEPVWGRHKARTAFAVAGNHDYNTPGAAGFYGYFGAAAGDPAKGYYDATVGTWHVIVLNSNCEEVGGCGAGSPQEQWLRSVLATSDAECTLTMWHQPAFSSATAHRAFPAYQPFWRALYDYGADVVLVGSDHVYERFGFQNPVGDSDAPFGLRQFTVGTGGRSHQSFKSPLPNSEVRNGATFGVLALSLHPGSYDWKFVSEAGGTFTDQGASACHGAPPAPAPEPGPITRVASTGNSATSARSLTLGRPEGTLAGQVMVASIATSDDDTPAAPDGWTIVRSDAVPGKLSQTIYIKVAGVSEPPAYAWTLTEWKQFAGGITTYSGVDGAGPIEVAAATVTASKGTAVTTPAVATTVPGMLVHFAAINAEGTLVPPPGTTQRWLAAAPVAAVTDVLAASYDARQTDAGSSGTATATATEPGVHIASVVALRPAP